jgi:hypothetical protein
VKYAYEHRGSGGLLPGPKTKDQAEALRLYVKQQGEGLHMQNMCAEIKLRAERRIGEMLKETVPHGGGNPQLSHDGTVRPPKLPELGITRNQSSRWQAIASLPEKTFEEQVRETV